MCSQEILQTGGNSLPTHLQAIVQPGGRWHISRLPHCLNPSSTSDNPPLLRRVSYWRDWIDWMPNMLGMNGEFISIVNDSRMMNIIRQFKYYHDIFSCHLECHQSITLKTISVPPHGQSLWPCDWIALANQATSIHDLALVIANISQCPSYKNVSRTNTNRNVFPAWRRILRLSTPVIWSHDIPVRWYFIKIRPS